MGGTKKQLSIPEREEQILKFWLRKKTFEQSFAKTKKGKEFVFYEGPPTANGMPGIHHVEARAFKDAVLRYKTMRGFHVPRRAGWDTHGLPVEIQVEKKLGFKTKQEIENYGIAKFNAEAKQSVWEYKEVWERLTRRMGFWIDMKRPYITYETTYIESLWWIIKEFWKRGLLYEDFKVVPWCSRCQTGLSSHEVGLGYQEVKDTAVYVKFKLKPGQEIGDFEIKENDPPTYILAWTTTPWTLPGNIGLAIDPKLEYLVVKKNFLDRIGYTEWYIIAKDAIGVSVRGEVLKKLNLAGFDKSGEWLIVSKRWEDHPNVVRTIKGNDLLGLQYESLFEIQKFQESKNSYKIYPAGFVSATEGTGVVHTAVMYGEDDYQLGKKVGLPTFHTVDETGRFVKEVKGLVGWSIATRDDKQKTEAEIIRILGDNIFYQAPYPHEYPHCWRCSTPLLYYARKAWWVRTTAVKKELLANNEGINWVPEHLKHGRFGEFLRDVRDWCFSRERYWGTPLPIWKCEKCGEIEVIGSTDELKKRGGSLPRDEKNNIDLHRPYVDAMVFSCIKKDCTGMMRRVPEVADVWFDSGAMPFAQGRWPFAKNQEVRIKNQGLAYPADYICEGVDQTRGWFYSMLAIATLLGRPAPYKNVISMGILLDSKGEKMSKSKGNIVVPQEMADKYGMDALRWYFFTINAPGDEKKFDEKDVALRQRGFVATLWNSFVFFDTYVAKIKNQKIRNKSKNVLDQWILAKLNMLVAEVTRDLDRYDLVGAARAIDEFTISDFSQWFVRRSRRRFQHPENAQEKKEAAAVMAQVLLTLAELSAPFAPFIAEAVYQGLRKKMKLKEESVHLKTWPVLEKFTKNLVHRQNMLNKQMSFVRDYCSRALKIRAEEGIKVRQPLAVLEFTTQNPFLDTDKQEFMRIIKDEVNVKDIVFGKEDLGKGMRLDTIITPELKEEGMAREIIRNIQEMRRELKLTPQRAARMRLFFGTPAMEVIVKKYTELMRKETRTHNAAGIVGNWSPRVLRTIKFEEGELRIEMI